MSASAPSLPPVNTASSPGGLRAIVGMMFAPGQLLQQHARCLPAGLALFVSGAAFALFFLQSGLDQLRVGKATWPQVVDLALVGAVYGVIGVGLVGLVAWVLTRPFGQGKSLAWATQAYALAYAPALIYGVCGLVFSLFGWRTAVAFGVTGVLWALSPLMAVNDELTGQRKFASGLLTAVLGCIILTGWVLLGTR